MFESETNKNLNENQILTSRINSEKKQKQKQNQRKIYINTFNNNNFSQTQKYTNNHIRTSKYTLLTFLPLSLFYQFNNAFNLFFLVTAIITVIP